nr:DUF1800 domain-containing protein [uncultured Lichenicoccus sp.]
MIPAVTPLSPVAIALNRFGLGVRAEEDLPGDARRWLLEQFDSFDTRPAAFAALADAGAIVQHYRVLQRKLRQAAHAKIDDESAELKAARQAFSQATQALYRDAVQARAQSALATSAPFVERMVHFWSNHFCVSADSPEIAAYAGAFERDAIRPHVLGRFSDMLLAAEQHPAMLTYLNQITSVGPDSVEAARAQQRQPGRRLGLNENLGRQIMELHTLGVRSGYSQDDVTEFARALTGWNVDGLGGGHAQEGDADRFAFRPSQHEPGMRTIMHRTYGQDGEAQAGTVLLDFARSPHTATDIATKLARHFAGDTPPPRLVARLAAAFSGTGGHLPSLYRTLILSPEPWAPRPLKFKTPWEWTISTLRGLGQKDPGHLQVARVQAQLGQPVWKPGSPAGWDDVAASWAAPDALLRRVEFAQRLAATYGDRIDARTAGTRILPASLSIATAEQVRRSESPTSALALLLVSPDFLRR